MTKKGFRRICGKKMNVEILFERIHNSLEKVYEYQGYLIENKVHERSIVFWDILK